MAGSRTVNGDISAEHVTASGALCCSGLINAEEIFLKADRQMTVGSIGGGRIILRRTIISPFIKRRILVSTAIEGDELSLSYVTCPAVTGRTVTVGKGCRIDLVQYSENVEISPGARVGRVEKI